MKDMISKYSPSCIGETGLDFFRNLSTYEEQIYAFEEQIKLAIEFNKPLYLHQRDSHEDFIKIINQYKNSLPKCVVHCFTGTQSELDDYLDPRDGRVHCIVFRSTLNMATLESFLLQLRR